MGNSARHACQEINSRVLRFRNTRGANFTIVKLAVSSGRVHLLHFFTMCRVQATPSLFTLLSQKGVALSGEPCTMLCMNQYIITHTDRQGRIGQAIWTAKSESQAIAQFKRQCRFSQFVSIERF